MTYKVDELNTLNRIMSDFASIGSGQDLFKRVVDLSIELSHADEACFYVINEALQRPVQVARSVAGGHGGRRLAVDGTGRPRRFGAGLPGGHHVAGAR